MIFSEEFNELNNKRAGALDSFPHMTKILYPRSTSFSDPKGSFGKIIKLLGNSYFQCIAHFRTIFGQYV